MGISNLSFETHLRFFQCYPHLLDTVVLTKQIVKEFFSAICILTGILAILLWVIAARHLASYLAFEPTHIKPVGDGESISSSLLGTFCDDSETIWALERLPILSVSCVPTIICG